MERLSQVELPVQACYYHEGNYEPIGGGDMFYAFWCVYHIDSLAGKIEFGMRTSTAIGHTPSKLSISLNFLAELQQELPGYAGIQPDRVAAGNASFLGLAVSTVPEDVVSVICVAENCPLETHAI